MNNENQIRDVIILSKGDTLPVATDANLIRSGWAGGQGVQWVSSSKDEFLVTPCDGKGAGFLLWGSNEASDQYIATTGQQPHYGYSILCYGGWIIQTLTYERYTYASRILHTLNPTNPLVPLGYQENDRLTFSLRGFWTSEDEWSLSMDPRAPNTNYVGFVVQNPLVSSTNHMTIQTWI